MDPVPQPAPRVCPKHGVVRDPLGHCVICRREDAEPEDDPGGARKALSGLVLLGVTVGCVLLYKALTVQREPPVVRDTAVAAAPPAQAPPIEELTDAQQDARAAAQVHDAEDRRVAIEKKMREIPIQVYTTQKCDLCRTATAFLKGKGYKFTEVDVDASAEDLAAMRRKNPKNTVPTIVVGDEVIAGFGPTVVTGAVYRTAAKQVL